jgi:hypothetical protein
VTMLWISQRQIDLGRACCFDDFRKANRFSHAEF